MGNSFGSGAVRLVAAVAAWRVVAELLQRRRELARAGELAPRIEARRQGRIERALAHAGYGPARRPVLATVQVGAIGASDVDDVGLLEAAMRRRARDRALVTPVDERAAVHGTDWGALASSAGPAQRARRAVAALGTLPFVAIVTGVVLTFVPLVRPLSDASPWLALGGLALVAVGWFASRPTR